MRPSILFFSPLAVAAAGLFITACGDDETAAIAVPPRPVRTTVVEAGSPTVTRSFSGLVDSTEGTSIAFEVGGRVIEVQAKEGIRYEKGAPLARLDSSEFENQLNSARAQMTEATQSLRRVQQLFETGNSSKSQLESAIAAEKGASTNFKTAEKQVADSSLKMPYAGVIGSVGIDPQMIVSAGQAVMSIQGEGGMQFDVGVPAAVIETLKVGMDANISLGDFPDDPFAAKVDSISPQISTNTTYPVTLSFVDEDKRIRDGMDGEAQVSLPNPFGEVIRIPAGCVATTPDSGKFVWRVDKEVAADVASLGRVQRQPVEIGALRDGGTIEILSGLEPGQIVVSRGVHRLEDGQQVSFEGPGGDAN